MPYVISSRTLCLCPHHSPHKDNVLPLLDFTGSSLVAVARLDNNSPAIATLLGTLWWNCSWSCTLRARGGGQSTNNPFSAICTMTAATQLAMSASSFLCPTTVAPKQVVPNSTQSPCRHTSVVVSQTINPSRRVFAVAAASATVALGVLGQPEAQAKRNKPPPPEEKKKEEEDRSLSAYDARLLANARRKEAMKAAVEAAKLKAKSIASAE